MRDPWGAAAAATFVLVAPGTLRSLLMGFWDAVASNAARRAFGAMNIALGVGIGWMALVAI